MFDSIIAALRGALQGLWEALLKVSTTVWAVVVAGVGIVTSLVGTVHQWVSDAAASLATVILPAFNFPMTAEVASIMGLANRIYPLVELFVQLVIWGGLCAFLMAYHLVKSWIPAVSGS